MKGSKWGNSLALRLPASVVETLKLKEGDHVEVFVVGERTSVSIAIELEKMLSNGSANYAYYCRGIGNSIATEPILDECSYDK